MKSIVAFVRRISSTLKSTLSLGLEERTLVMPKSTFSEAELEELCFAVSRARAVPLHLEPLESLESYTQRRLRRERAISASEKALNDYVETFRSELLKYLGGQPVLSVKTHCDMKWSYVKATTSKYQLYAWLIPEFYSYHASTVEITHLLSKTVFRVTDHALEKNLLSLPNK